MRACRWLALTVAAVVAVEAGVFAAQTVEIRLDAPAGVEAYSGPQPVSFGVPFERGLLRRSHGLRVRDEAGRAVPAQFEATAAWMPDSDAVRWLLVDLVAEVRGGRPPRLFLDFGPDVPRSEMATPLKADLADGRAVIETGARRFAFDRASGVPGRFTLTDGQGKVYRAGGPAGRFQIALERVGPARVVLKAEGDYAAEDGSRLAEFVTRARFYASCPFVRVYHTMVWLADASTGIGRLSFEPFDVVEGAKAGAGVDGRRLGSAASLSLRQADWDAVSGDGQGKRLDGWVEVTSANTKRVVALRWPWQQFPTSIRFEAGRLEIGLIGPERPMSLAAMDVAVDAVKPHVKTWNLRIFDDRGLWSVKHNGEAALPHVSPRGVAKTWELLLWDSAADDPTPAEAKNVFCQHPTLGCADPAFATRAGLPSPSSAADPKAFPDVEAALQRAFGWFTLERASDGDYGVWNFGDLQWCWAGGRGYTTYRYWMNHGKGWAVLPWTLWLRSGDRRYWENGEANSRHAMDVDTCHVPEWTRAEDGKIRGGQYHYSALHWGYGPEVSTFYMDSEYLPYCWFMTGYERARDVMLERVEALARDDLQTRVKRFTENRAERSRHLYVMVKDLCALYEATWDPRLLPYARAYLDLTLDAQQEDGGFLGIKTNHYLEQSLLIAHRVMGDERIVNALKRWQDLLGDPDRPGHTSSIGGPWSLWTSVLLTGRLGDPHYLAAAARVMKAQATSVDDGDSEWRGMCVFPGHEAGPLLRDWTVVMAALAARPAAERPTEPAPMVFFEGSLPLSPEEDKEGWKERHVALTLDERDEMFTVRIYYMAHNFGVERLVRARVIGPDGQALADSQRKMHPGTPPFAVEVPADGKKGVYAVEAFSTIRRCPARIESTLGKTVHLAPGKTLSLYSPVYAGRVWFEPKGDEEVVFGHPVNEPAGRIAAFGPDGVLLASSRLTGTRNAAVSGVQIPQPVGEPCRFRPKAAGIHSLVAGVDKPSAPDMPVSGIRPFLAGRHDEWFDPTRYPCPSLDALARQAKAPAPR